VIETVIGIAGAGLLLLGLTLASIGLYGMLRKPVIFEQLHAAGLVTGSGVILVLLASLASGRAEIVTSAVLVVAFVLVTSSLSIHAIALTAWRVGAGSTEAAGRGEVSRAVSDAGEAGSASTGMRVLVAHDGSPGAGMATSLTASLPWVDGTVIRVIGAMEGELEPVPPTGPDPEANDEPVDLRGELEAAALTLRRPGVAVEAVVRPGDPAAAIIHEAEDFGAHLVVTGSRGLGRIESLFAGSVAAAVIDAAPCPVLVARTPSVHRVLLATDGSAPSVEATEVLAHWPLFGDLPIEVLSVAPVVEGDEAIETARQQAAADGAAMALRGAGRQPTTHVRAGDVADQIVRFAATRSIDLIVLGSRGRTGLTRALLGSVAREVLSSSQRSVLIVRAPRDVARRPEDAPT
jgi:monovalent cation/proton antiporter MnhG/PhaG subunit